MAGKSFMELLTGGSKQKNQKKQNVSKSPQSSHKGDYPSQAQAPPETSNDTPQQQREAREKPSSEDKDKREELLADSDEGQLTLDVYQDGSDIVVKSTIAGVKPENLEISIDNDMVTIKGERERDAEVLESNYYYQELYWGAFSRSVILPAEVDTEKAEAELANGILTIRLPKRESSEKKTIEVTKTG